MDSLIEIDRRAGSAYLLRDLIQERLGLAISDYDGISLIINKLAGRMNQHHCESILEYYHLLSSGSAIADEEAPGYGPPCEIKVQLLTAFGCGANTGRSSATALAVNITRATLANLERQLFDR